MSSPTRRVILVEELLARFHQAVDMVVKDAGIPGRRVILPHRCRTSRRFRLGSGFSWCAPPT